MEISTQTILDDYVGRANRGDLTTRQQFSLVQAIRELGGSEAAASLRKIIDAETADADVRVQAIRELNAVESELAADDIERIRDFLTKPGADLRLAILNLADESWFHEQAELVDALADLALNDSSPEVMQTAQIKLLAHPPTFESTAAAIVSTWLDEQDRGIRSSSFQRRVDELRDQQQDRLGQATGLLAERLSKGARSENWTLLGRMRRAGEAITARSVPFVTAVSRSRELHVDGDKHRPSLWRCMTLALIGTALASLPLFGFDFARVGSENILAYALGSWALAALSCWLFSRFMQPLNTSPDRLAHLIPQIVSAGLIGLVISLSAVLILHFSLVDVDSGLELFEEIELRAFIVLWAAFVLVRAVGGLAYGLSQHSSWRWSLQASCGALIGLGLLLGASYIPIESGLPLEVFMYMFFAPALIAVAMASADIDNSAADQSAVDNVLGRGFVVAATSVAAILIFSMPLYHRGISVGSDAAEDLGMGLPEWNTEVRLGDLMPLSSSYNHSLEITATGIFAKDIAIEVFDEQAQQVGFVDNAGTDQSESLTFPAQPSGYSICVRDYLESCQISTIDQDISIYAFANSFGTRVTVWEDSPGDHSVTTPDSGLIASLTIRSSITDEQRARYQEFGDWVVPDDEIDSENADMQQSESGYYIVAEHTSLKIGEPTNGANEEFPRESNERSPIESRDREFIGSDVKIQRGSEAVDLSKGSLLYYQNDTGQLFVIDGALSERFQVINIDRLPPNIVRLDARPDSRQLEIARDMVELSRPADYLEVSATGWLDLIESQDDPGMTDILAALESWVGGELADGSLAFALNDWRSDGAAIFKITDSRNDGGFDGVVELGWREAANIDPGCYLLRASDLIPIRDEPGWAEIIEKMYAQTQSEAELVKLVGSGPYPSECPEPWAYAGLPRYDDDDALLKLVPLGEPVLLDAQSRVLLDIKASTGVEDIIISIYDSDGSSLEYIDYSSTLEEFTWRSDPGSYTLCIHSYDNEQSCFADPVGLQALKDLETSAGIETYDLDLPSDHAWLEIKGTLPVEQRRADRWLASLREGAADDAGGNLASPQQFVATGETLSVLSAGDPTAPQYVVATEETSFEAPIGEVTVSQGTILLEQDNRWSVVQGFVTPQERTFIADLMPAPAVPLGQGSRPTAEQLSWAWTTAAVARKDDMVASNRGDLILALERDAENAADLLERRQPLSLAEDIAVGEAYAAIVAAEGSGIYSIFRTAPEAPLLGRLAYGTSARGTSGRVCIELPRSAVYLGSGWDSAWDDAIDELNAHAETGGPGCRGRRPDRP